MLAYFADAANTSIFILKAFYYPIKNIDFFYDCNNTWNCQIYSFPEISGNFNLIKALHSG